MRSLKSVIAAVLDVDPTTLSEASGMNETDGWDSLKQFLIMSDVENRFGVSIPFGQIEDATNVAAIRAVLLGLGVSAAD